MIRKFYYLCGILVLFSISSCRVFYANEMFKQKDYQFFELAKKKVEEYVIAPGDELTLEVYSRDGFKLVDVLGGSLNTSSTSSSSGPSTGAIVTAIEYLVDKEGFVKFPVLGMLYVKGYTQNELEAQLAQRYASLFVNPFVILRVTNRRVFLFKGDVALIVPLNNAPTNLIEVLAHSGGLARNLKAYKVKIIRGDLANPQVRILDLSTLEGLRNADLIVQSNDIIYVEQTKVITDLTKQILPVISPILSVVSLVVTVSVLSRTFK